MKVGDYVRTEISSLNLQRIGKIKEIISEYFIHTDIGTYDKEYIIKTSPNIIDLIEVGDYVNGSKVIEVDNKDNELYNKYIVVELCNFDNEYESYSNNDIKLIVTKEQFESMEYKIKEDKQ